MPFRRTEAIWSPQEVERRSKTDTRSDARSRFSSSEWAESMLKPMEYSSSAGIKKDHVLHPVLGDIPKNPLDQVAVRIKHCHALAGLDVGLD